MSDDGLLGSELTRSRRRAAPAGPSPARLQVVRRADHDRIRPRDQRRRRAERLGQEQPRRRPALGARRAGPGASLAQGRGRHLGRIGEARRAGDGRRHARHRQRRRPAAGRLPGPRAGSAPVSLGRERLPPQQVPRPAARPGRPARRRAPRRQRLPVHRPGDGRPGAGPATRGAPAAVRRGRRRPAARAPTPARRGAAGRSPRRTWRASRTSSPSSARRRAGWPPRPSSRPAASRRPTSSPRRCSTSMHARWHRGGRHAWRRRPRPATGLARRSTGCWPSSACRRRRVGAGARAGRPDRSSSASGARPTRPPGERHRGAPPRGAAGVGGRAPSQRDRRRSTDERSAAEAELAGRPARAGRADPGPGPGPRGGAGGGRARAGRRDWPSSPSCAAPRRPTGRSWRRCAGPRPTRQAEIETAQRRLADVERRVADERDQAAPRRLSDATGSTAELGAARTALEAALDAERAATIEHEAARQRAGLAAAARVAAAERLAGAGRHPGHRPGAADRARGRDWPRTRREGSPAPPDGSAGIGSTRTWWSRRSSAPPRRRRWPR